jgi:pimeloyl-ACP methyl ester carboxylesterase
LKKISAYIFSGLGTDERIFRNIHFQEFAETYFVAWKKPFPKETLERYVDRLLKEFDLTKPIILIGLSFGGVVAQEAAKKINPLQTIIISSISSHKELPWYFRLCRSLKLYRITPFRLLKFANKSVNWFFGAKRKEDKKLMAGIIQDADVSLLKWSVEQLLLWRNEISLMNLFHIHGDSDKLLPLKNKKVDVVIKGGTHLMIYNRAEEIEKILKEQLSLQNGEFNNLATG